MEIVRQNWVGLKEKYLVVQKHMKENVKSKIIYYPFAMFDLIVYCIAYFVMWLSGNKM